MKRFIHFTIFAFTFFLGIVSADIVRLADVRTSRASDREVRLEGLQKAAYRRFRLLHRGFNTYEFRSSGGEERFDNGANISVLHNFVGPDGMRDIFEANCRKNRRDYSIERSFKPDKNGKRCVIVDRSGKARIIWNESETEYWTIDATSLEVAKEFENSETFRLMKFGKF